jgi:hypothetical protein
VVVGEQPAGVADEETGAVREVILDDDDRRRHRRIDVFGESARDFVLVGGQGGAAAGPQDAAARQFVEIGDRSRLGRERFSR